MRIQRPGPAAAGHGRVPAHLGGRGPVQRLRQPAHTDHHSHIHDAGLRPGADHQQYRRPADTQRDGGGGAGHLRPARRRAQPHPGARGGLVQARAGQPHPGRRHRRGAARRGGVSAQWLHPSTPVPGWIGLVGAVALFGCAALNNLATRKRLTEASSASVRARAERRRRRHPQRGRHHRHELFRGTVRVSASAKN